jgi:D-tyrosyl-tRNA(Tyr) deacylase
VRAVVQRVRCARVSVDGEAICSMGEGLLALVGVGRGDAAAQAHDLARRLVHLRVFNDAAERMNRSLLDTGGTLGIVSQFDLGVPVVCGQFQAMMDVALVNAGPVTILLDTEKQF